jgi:LTXXQ motif family protein
MLKFSGYPTAALLASALAMSTLSYADAAQKPGAAAPAAHPAPHAAGGVPHFAPHIGGGAPHFAPRAGGGAPHFNPHVGAAAPRHFTPHVGAAAPRFTTRGGTPHFTRHFHATHGTNRTATVNRSLHVTSPSQTTGSINRNASIRHMHDRGRHDRDRNNLAHTNPNALQTQQTQSSLASVPHARDRHHHHDGNAISTQTARQGRFASRFASRAQSDPNWRSDNVAARRAWHHHHRAGFVAWYGPVFWPYAYSDIFDYAFWPYGYDDGYWDYAYDNFIDGLFWGGYGPPEDYAYAYAPPSGHRAPRVSYAGVQELCKEPGSGITAWPFADIQRKVGLNDEQKQLLGEVRKAAADAAATFKASCPAENTFPLTPPGRLTAMTGRLQATLEAVKIVQPALDKFYNSLSDEQKERFNQLGPQHPANSPETTAALPHDSKSCTEAKPGLANLPIEKIGDVVKPTDAQQADFKKLQDATVKAVATLQAACPDDTPLTPPGRLDAMRTRLQAMIDAAQTVKPALDGFYSSLSSEQKARFDRIGQTLAQAND